MKRLLCFGFLAALIVSYPVARLFADDKKADPAREARAEAGRGDQEFVNEAATGGMLEVKLGQLALDNATNADVKKFGEQMVKDHSKANRELKELVEKKGMNCPKELDAKQQKELDRFSKLRGGDFDRAYVQLMLDDHKQDVSKFENQAKNGQDPALKEFALKTLPTLREHLGMIQTLANRGR